MLEFIDKQTAWYEDKTVRFTALKATNIVITTTLKTHGINYVIGQLQQGKNIYMSELVSGWLKISCLAIDAYFVFASSPKLFRDKRKQKIISPTYDIGGYGCRHNWLPLKKQPEFQPNSPEIQKGILQLLKNTGVKL